MFKRTYEAFGKRVRDSRVRQGISLSKLAKMANLSKGGLWQLENDGRANPTAYTVWQLAIALHETPAALLGIQDNSND